MARTNIERLIDTKLAAPTYKTTWSPVMKLCRWWTAQRTGATLINRTEAGKWTWWYDQP